MSARNSFSDVWRFVQKTDSCWNWIGAKNRKGYGQFRLLGRLYMSHRLIFENVIGPIPEGHHVLHRCDNPPCVNPDHLFVGTNQENVDDKMQKRRHWIFSKTACKSGHPRTPENIRTRKDGTHACRVCEREICRKYSAKVTADPKLRKMRCLREKRNREERTRRDRLKDNNHGLQS